MIAEFKPTYRQLFLSLQMIADELDDRLWKFTLYQDGESPSFRGFQVYTGQKKLEQEYLYLLQPGQAMTFPKDQFSYLTQEDLAGKAPHIRNLDKPMLEILNEVNRIFQKYRDFEAELNRIVNDGGSLTDLCRVGTSFFQNPMYIHDNVFTVIALPSQVEGMLKFDYNKETDKYYIPLWLIEDFKFSSTYTQTLYQQRASIWGTDRNPYHIRSLYVNIWDGGCYRARMLINELYEPLRPGQFRLAELFAEYVKLILRRDEMNTNSRNYRSFEDTVKSLVAGRNVDHSDLRQLLTTLEWEESDEYLCIKMQSQKADIAITSSNVLRSTLSTVFRGIFCTFYEQQLCVIVNLPVSGYDVLSFRSALAPLVRDSYMYGGSSFPIHGVHQLGAAFQQADIALEQAFLRRSSQWFIPFEDCALAYMMEHVETRLPAEMLASPALQQLHQHDQQKNTQYYETLRTYLRCERSIPRTAAELIVHRTTLIYRLEKINELIKLDLDDSTTRLYLLLSFLIMEGKVLPGRAWERQITN